MAAGTLYVAIKGDTKELVSALRSAKNEATKTGKATAKAFDPLGKVLGAVKTQVLALGSAWVGIQGAKAILRIADQYALLDSKIQLITDSTEEYNKVQKGLFELSQRTGTSFSNNTQNYANMALAMKDTNITSEEMLTIFEDVNKSLVVAGATIPETISFMLQFRQAMGSGKLAGDEFRGMMEANSY